MSGEGRPAAFRGGPRGRPRRPAAALGAFALAGLLGGAAPGDGARDLLAVGEWQALPAAGVELELAAAAAPGGAPALRLAYDFQGRGGWAAARRPLDLELPAYYELRFELRGEGPVNDLEVKLVDPTGDNVWWHVRRAVEWPAAWTPVRVKKRQVTFAWGPAGGGEPGRIGFLELTVTAREGGRGWIEVAGLEIVPAEPPTATPGPLTAIASSAAAGHPPRAAVDGDASTSWRPGERDPIPAELHVDLGGRRELGGVTLRWEDGRAPRAFSLALSEGGDAWATVRQVTAGGAPRSHVALPDTEASALRLHLPAGACPAGCGLAEVVVRPLEFGASAEGLFGTVAREAPRGAYPRGFSGEQVYWTVVGRPGAPDEALFDEDGAVELGERGPRLEPFVRLGGRLYSWADVTAEQSLADGELPIPTVTWRLPGARLEVTALVAEAPGERAAVRAAGAPCGPDERSSGRLLVRYRLTNESTLPLAAELLVALRPFQVNPPTQFLNVAGGVAPLTRVACTPEGLGLQRTASGRGAAAPAGEGVGEAAGDAAATPAGLEPVVTWPAPAGCGALTFDAGELHASLGAAAFPAARAVADDRGFATGVLAWPLAVAPGGAAEVTVAAPLAGSRLPPQPLTAGAFAAAEGTARDHWRAWLGGTTLDLPPEAADLARTVRSNLAWIAIHSDGAAIQPGSRAYARSWIRDGALTGVALLRLGRGEVARRFVEWFAGFQYPDGKVPCCVDRRGADPVPEHDSHGELIHLVAEVWRYTGDRPFAERLFPHVVRAVEAIEALRQQRRTPEYRTPEKLAFFGLLPESISHEGYAAKPVHSYWDDTFAYRGLADATELAAALGHEELAAAWARRRDELRDDLLASIARVRGSHGLATLPASADLADFDSTSTTTMLDPGGLLPWLPRPAVEATFERFWREFVARRDGTREWDGYTPYEVRHVGAFVRLGWKERAHELLAWYLGDRRPRGWNAWPEAAGPDWRAPRFLGDLPHGWVGSDFIRSTLDLFAYERREDAAVVLGAGVPLAWLKRPEGVVVRGLATPWGKLDLAIRRRRGAVAFQVGGSVTVPPGGFVLVSPDPAPVAVAKLAGRDLPLEGGSVVLRQAPATVWIVHRPTPGNPPVPPAARPAPGAP